MDIQALMEAVSLQGRLGAALQNVMQVKTAASVPRKANTGRKLLTLNHDEFIGCGLGAPDLAPWRSGRERKDRETLGFGNRTAGSRLLPSR
jgi:hypothetical protein